MFNKNLEEQENEFNDQQIDLLLSRETVNINCDNIENVQLVKSDINDYYLSGFKLTSLSFENFDTRKNEVTNKDINNYW